MNRPPSTEQPSVVTTFDESPTPGEAPAPEDASGPRALVLVTIAIVFGAMPWFAGTGVSESVASHFAMGESGRASLTSSVQLGFIVGSLLVAASGASDRWPPTRVFAIAATLAASFNLGFAWLSTGPTAALGLRFLTGVALGGVYPVAMRIVASWYREGLGWRLGFLIGGLTLGTAAPWALQPWVSTVDWRVLVSLASVGAVLGASLVLLAGEGPHLRARVPLRLDALREAFANPRVRAPALAYFGHMFELYAVWASLGPWLAASFRGDEAWQGSSGAVAFVGVAIGAVGCVVGGRLSLAWGERRVAATALLGSGLCCLASPLAFFAPAPWVIVFVLVWGTFVVADSAQFSAMATKACPPAIVGSALAAMNGVGFAITVASIQLVAGLAELVGWSWALPVLAIGPASGLWQLRDAAPTRTATRASNP